MYKILSLIWFWFVGLGNRGVTTTSDFPVGLVADSYDYYWENYDNLPKTWPQVYQEKRTNRRYEKSTSAVGTGLLIEKPEGQKGQHKAPTEGFTVYGSVKAWMKIEEITKELHDDHQKLKEFMKSQMPQWTQDVVETQETFYANVFNYGGYTAGHAVFNATVAGNVLDDPSGDVVYDSESLIGTAHVNKAGTSYDNALGALNISKTNLQTAWNRMTITNNRREDDTKMSIRPANILCSPALKFTLDELLKSQDDPTTSNRAVNVMHKLVNPIYWQYLTDADQWTLLAANKLGLKALIRENPEFDMWEDKEAKTFFMSIWSRFGLMIDNYRGIVSANYATAT